MSIRKYRPTLAAWLVCVLFAALVLVFCTGTSPLYNGHDWTDPNTYLTVGRGLLRGTVPYRDLFDHKGPLLYFIFALGALLHPTGFFGVFFLQVISLGTALFFFYGLGLMLLKSAPRAAVCAAVLPFFVLTAGIYYLPDLLDYGGGSAEEFCLPLLAAALWLSARCELRGSWGKRPMLAMGVLAGCVALIKFNLVLFWVGLLLPVFLRFLVRRQWKEFLTSALWGALGVGIALAPYLLYALATGSLDDFFRVYIRFNSTYAAVPASPAVLARELLTRARNTLVSHHILAAALVLLPLGLLLLYRAPAVWRLSLLLAFGALSFALFCGRVIPYNMIPLLPAAFFGAAGLVGLLPRELLRGRWKRPAAALLSGALCLALGAAAVGNNQMLGHKDFAWSGTPTCQEEIAALIRSGPYEEPTLLEAGMLNRGFYNELGLTPTVYYFYMPNILYAQYPDILDSQLTYIQNAVTDYVVLQSALPSFSPESLPSDPMQANLCLAALENYQLVAVVKGTGAVDDLNYHLYVRR